MFGKRKLKDKYGADPEFQLITHGAEAGGCFTYPFKMDTLMYADDGIRYGNYLPAVPVQGEGHLQQYEAFYENMRSSGVEFNWDKSG